MDLSNYFGNSGFDNLASIEILGGDNADLISPANHDSFAVPIDQVLSVVRGGDDDDIITGGSANDFLFGDNDADILDGGDGNDYLYGGDGNDTSLRGADGDDHIWGEAGNDTIYTVYFQDPGSADDRDYADGEAGDDTIYGGAGQDKLLGGSGSDTIFGRSNVDELHGGSGNDTLWSNSGLSDIDQDILGDGEADCDIEDGVIECFPDVVPDGYHDLRKNIAKVIAAPGILANDDPDGGGHGDDALTDIAITQAPAHGTLTLSLTSGVENGGFTFTPATGYTGSDFFKYTITNAHGTSNEATVSLTISNTAPTGNGEGFNATLGQGGSVTYTARSVLDNDTDANGDALVAELYSGATKGSVVLFSNGNFTYTTSGIPQTTDTDTFMYRAFDGTAYGPIETATINISNPAPFGNPNTYPERTFNYNTRLINYTSTVLHNDGKQAGETLVVGSGDYLQPSHGAVNMYGDGTFVYTPHTGYVGSDSFTYRPYDNNSAGNWTTVNLSINNPSPVSVNDTHTHIVPPPGIVSSPPNVLTNDYDSNDTSLVVVNYVQPSHGTVSMSTNGNFYYTPTPGYYGSDVFWYRSNDQWTHGNPGRVDITIPSPMNLDGEAIENSSEPALTTADVDAALLVASQAWLSAGVSTSDMETLLANLQVIVTDLAGAQLGAGGGLSILLDTRAAGHGWYIDSTPETDDEFADSGSPAATRADLLTVLMHEMGHLLGLAHDELGGDLMQDDLGLGQRRRPAAIDPESVSIDFGMPSDLTPPTQWLEVEG